MSGKIFGYTQQDDMRSKNSCRCKVLKAATASLLAVALSTSLVACGVSGGGPDANSNTSAQQTTQSSNELAQLSGTVSKHPKFDTAVLSVTSDDLAQAGYELGDSVDVEFGNGVKLTDIPYYNGYYVVRGAALMVAYPTEAPQVVVGRNNMNFWSAEGLEDGESVIITLNTKAKYLTTQDTLAQDYSTDRDDYDSDEQFANFRALIGGKLKENLLYRGATPVNNSKNRAAVVDGLLQKNGIKNVIDLSDNKEEFEEDLAADDFSSDYTKALYEDGHDVLLGMGSDYTSETFLNGVAKGMRFLIKNDGPTYIHCIEGKDRTGFVCMMLEALAGASIDEMCADYMTTYANYYGITKESEPERYDAVKSLYFDSFVEFFEGYDEDTLSACAKDYLKECGLTKKEIKQLVERICK